MKKLILTAAMVIGASAAFGQGELILNNGGGTQITNEVTGLRWAAGPDSIVAIYGAAGGGQAASSLVFQPTAVTNLFAPGLFAGGTRTLGIPAGLATIQIRAWSGASFPNYEAAELASLGGNPSVVLGRSNPFNLTLTISPAGAPPTQGNFAAFTVEPVPEPSSIALGLLGLGAIVLFRRRK